MFEVAASSGTITTLASFTGANGANPNGGLIEDSSGNLFGTTSYGGPSGDGTVFEVADGSGTITTLASFTGNNGANPSGGLIEDSSGNLFGTTNGGGPSGDGTVFEVAAGSGTITTLASFNGANGANPQGGLVEDSSGNLFGTTCEGGPNGLRHGVRGGRRQRHHHHPGLLQRRQRRQPQRQPDRGQQRQSLRHHLPMAVPSGDGTVFEVAAGSGTITTLASFTGANGAYPYGGLVEDSSGNLFGTTPRGGTSGDGTVFEVDHGSGTITTLASFNGTNGASPQGGLVEDSSGNLFGTTSQAGPSGDGTVFEVATGSGTITTLASFNWHQRRQPRRRPGRGQQRQSLRHHLPGRRVWQRHGVRGGDRQRDHHHPGFLQRHQRRQPLRRPDRGQQRQSLRHHFHRRHLGTARCSRSP